MANLFLHYSGRRWTLQAKIWDLRKAGTFLNIFSFTDEFGNNYNNSYLDELEVQNKNEEPSLCKNCPYSELFWSEFSRIREKADDNDQLKCQNLDQKKDSTK